MKIDKNGNIWLQRAGVMKAASCPYGEWSCGDHCVWFKEPRMAGVGEDTWVTVVLCKGDLTCSSKDFIDERH